MKTRFEKENDFALFKEELVKRLDRRETRDLENPGFKHASVMMLIMEKDEEPQVLLTKRSQKVATHKGQISFPGGGVDEDEDFLEAAYRETWEEVGIPREKIELLGRFDDYISLYGFHISCFIGAIQYPYQYLINRDELTEVLEAPLSIFIERKYDRVELYNHMGHNYRVYHYLHNGYEIWGLTARILTDFAEEILC